jgi:hypothetical protein
MIPSSAKLGSYWRRFDHRKDPLPILMVREAIGISQDAPGLIPEVDFYLNNDPQAGEATTARTATELYGPAGGFTVKYRILLYFRAA